MSWRQVVLVLSFCFGTPVLQAGFEIRISSPITTSNTGTPVAGSTGNFFDVELVNTNAAPVQSYELSGFNVQLSIAGLSGVTFTTVTEASGNYVFAGNNFGILSTPNGSMIDWNDISFSTTTIATGESYSLGRVFFDVSSAATAGVYTIEIEPTISTLSDENFVAIPFRASNGSLEITTNSVNPVPGPASIGLGVSGILTCLLRRRRKS